MINKFFLDKKLKGIIVAMDAELTPIIETLKPYEVFKHLDRIYYYNDKAIITKSGIGEINSAATAEAMISLLNGKDNLELIINLGLCGSLKKHKIGDIFIVKDVVHYDFDLTKIDNLLIGQYPGMKNSFFECDTGYFDHLKKLYGDKIHLVRCASGDKFIADPETQKFLIEKFGADICEMEAAGIIISAKKHAIPAMFIKAVSDIVENENSQNEFYESTKTVVKNYMDVLKLILDNKLTKQIPSFDINHNTLEIGFYTSKIDGDIFTYDLRFKKPNQNDYLPNDAIHSIEHQMATFLRNSDYKEKIVYFGPMGCRTGFYLVLKNAAYEEAKKITETALEQTIESQQIFGNSKIECGNFQSHNLETAKNLCKQYLEKIKNKKFQYK